MSEGNKECVSAEVAEAEFERFVEAMDLDVDPKGMDDEDRASFTSAKRRFVAAVQAGRLTVDEKGRPVFTPSMGTTDPITFNEPTGASLMAMDQKKRGHEIGKLFAAIADMTGQPVVRFSKMAKRDLNVCIAIGGLFLG